MKTKLPEGWLWLRIDPETWGLINCFDQEKTPEQIIKEALYTVASGSEREKVLEIVNWHIASAKQEFETGIERDGDRWVGCNSTDYPHGKLDALKKLKEELRKGGVP
jgi:hypothetical protein